MKLRLSKKSRLVIGLGSVVACAILIVVEVVAVILPIYSLSGQSGALTSAEIDARLHKTDVLVRVINSAIALLVVLMIVLVLETIISTRKRNGR